MTSKRCRNLLELSTEEKKKFLDSFDIVFSDIDGVLWNIQVLVPGAAEGFQCLQQAGKSLKFLTNNSVRPMELLLSRLAKLNFNMQESDIIHPAQSTVDYLKSINFEGLIYPIASRAFISVLAANGFKLHDVPIGVVEEDLAKAARLILDGAKIDAIVVDFDFNFNTLKAMKAYHYLKNSNCLLIGGAIDDYLPASSELSFLGPGPILRMMQEIAQRPMKILGKPSKDLGEVLIKRYELENSKRALMIGDMLQTDVAFGNEAGFQSVLVLSGGATLQELAAQTDEKFMPDYYLNSAGDFIEFMRDINKAKC